MRAVQRRCRGQRQVDDAGHPTRHHVDDAGLGPVPARLPGRAEHHVGLPVRIEVAGQHRVVGRQGGVGRLVGLAALQHGERGVGGHGAGQAAADQVGDVVVIRGHHGVGHTVSVEVGPTGHADAQHGARFGAVDHQSPGGQVATADAGQDGRCTFLRHVGSAGGPDDDLVDPIAIDVAHVVGRRHQARGHAMGPDADGSRGVQGPAGDHSRVVEQIQCATRGCTHAARRGDRPDVQAGDAIKLADHDAVGDVVAPDHRECVRRDIHDPTETTVRIGQCRVVAVHQTVAVVVQAVADLAGARVYIGPIVGAISRLLGISLANCAFLQGLNIRSEAVPVGVRPNLDERQVLVRLSVAVVIDSIAQFFGVRMDVGVRIVAVLAVRIAIAVGIRDSCGGRRPNFAHLFRRPNASAAAPQQRGGDDPPRLHGVHFNKIRISSE